MISRRCQSRAGTMPTWLAALISGGNGAEAVRHFLLGAPLPVPHLPSRMGTPSSPGLLIHVARSPLPFPLGQSRTGR